MNPRRIKSSRLSTPRNHQVPLKPSMSKFYDFSPKDSKGEPYPFRQLEGKLVLVVNTASKCGFTPQLASLEGLYEKYQNKGLDIVGFPCNQFGGQDPGSNDEIQEFCTMKYKTTFPVLGKIDVNGDHADPVYKWLKHEKPGVLGLERIKWNFEKFLVKDGKVIDRWASTTKPESLEKEIESNLPKA
jgi:glutathione peroxidase-family protein